MRDGSFQIYLIQHQDSKGRWAGKSDLGHFLFSDMSFDERRSERAAHYRDLVHPEHDCWQQTGTHGFLERDAAVAALEAIRDHCPDRQFRLVRRMWVAATIEEKA